MGYTTKFEGAFTLSKRPSLDVIVRLRKFEGVSDDYDEPGSPGGYCQWVLTKDFTGLKWDGNEKFYHYEEWLQWMIDSVFKPDGIELSGSVQFSGEDISDHGTLAIVDGKVVKTEKPIVGDDEVKEFRDFVVSNRGDSSDIVADWLRHKKRR